MGWAMGSAWRRALKSPPDQPSDGHWRQVFRSFSSGWASLLRFYKFPETYPPRKRQPVGEAAKGREERKMPETRKFNPLSALGPPPNLRGIPRNSGQNTRRPTRFFGLIFELVGPFKGFFSSKGFV